MFVCDCPTCGRRELRSLRSLTPPSTPESTTWTTTCRRCGATVAVVDQRAPVAA